MSNKEMIERRVENPDIRKFLQDNLDEIEKDVIGFRENLAATSKELRPFAKVAGEAFYSASILSSAPDTDTDKLKAAIERAIWDLCCTRDNGTGSPKPEVEDLFNEDGKGTAIIKEAIVVAFAAIGGFFAGVVGKFLAKFVALRIAEIIDKIVEDKFTKYCRNIPES